MVWSDAFINDLNLVNTSAPALLGFNEPDLPSQANMQPAYAASLWPKLEATGMRLGSPAVSASLAAIAWLDQFFGNCTGCRVDFIAVHWYSPWEGACTPDAFVALVQHYTKYGKPIWVTEFDCATGNLAQNLAFMQGLFPNITTLLPSLERYAWFTTRNYSSGSWYNDVNLFDDAGAPTPLGDYFRTV